MVPAAKRAWHLPMMHTAPKGKVCVERWGLIDRAGCQCGRVLAGDPGVEISIYLSGYGPWTVTEHRACGRTFVWWAPPAGADPGSPVQCWLWLAGTNPSRPAQQPATATSLLVLLQIERRHLSLFRDGWLPGTNQPDRTTEHGQPACVRRRGPRNAGWLAAWATATKPNTLPSTTRFSLQRRGWGA